MAIWARSLPSLEDIPTQGMFEDDSPFPKVRFELKNFAGLIVPAFLSENSNLLGTEDLHVCVLVPEQK